MSNVKALEGQWYSDRSTHDVFCVIGIDESEGLIGVRDGYGDVDEFDFAEWESMDLVLCAAPNEWAMDDTVDDEMDDHFVNGAAHDAMQEANTLKPTGPFDARNR